MSKFNFEQGLAFIIAELIRRHDQPTMAVSILEQSGFTIEQLKEAGVVKYDLKTIKKALRNK